MIDSRFKTSLFARSALLLVVAFLAVSGGSALAAKSKSAKNDARARYAQGIKALSQGHFREAALHFEAVSRMKKHAAAPFAAAAAWEKADDPVRAADNYALALSLPGLKKKDIKEAKRRLEALEQTMGTVVVEGRSDIVVQFERSTEVSPPARIHAMPGINTLLIARGEEVERRDVRLKTGETKTINVTEPLAKKDEKTVVEVPLASSTPPPPPPPPSSPNKKPIEESSSMSTRDIIGYSAMGAGVVSAGVAVVLGFQTLSAKSDYEGNPTRDSYDRAVGYRTWTNVAWAGSVVLGGVGAALVFWPSKSPKSDAQQDNASVSLVPSPTGIQLRGTF